MHFREADLTKEKASLSGFYEFYIHFEEMSLKARWELSLKQLKEGKMEVLVSRFDPAFHPSL